MAEGHDLLALYGTWRLHVKQEDQVKVDRLDRLIQRSQELADLYVRYLDNGKKAEKPADVALLDSLRQALCWTWIMSRDAIATVASDLRVDDAEDEAGSWDF